MRRVNNIKANGLLALPRIAALAVLRAYKWAISPMLPPSCRYTPTCSEYAAEAIARFGVLRGSVMAALRLLRCHPFVRGGYDPVSTNCVETDALARPAEQSSAKI